MSRFKKARKYNKPSVTLDEKIVRANKEFEKTGVLLEGPANRTSGIYYADKENPGTDAVMTPVPDPNGVREDGYTQPSNGYNASDSSTWANAYSNTDWLYNSNDVGGETNRPVLLSPNAPPAGQTIGRFGPGAGLIRATIGHGMALGYLGPGNTWQGILSNSYWGTLHIPNDSNRYGSEAPYRGYTDAEYAFMQDAYTKMQGTTFGREIKFWDGWSYFWYGSWEGYAGTKKEVAGGARYVLKTGWISSDPHDYESTPATPPTTTVIFKDDLGNDTYLDTSRFKKILEDLFGLGKSALTSLTGIDGEDNTATKIDKAFNKLLDTIGAANPLATALSKIPVFDYSREIAVSMATNEVVRLGNEDVSFEDKQNYINGMDNNVFNFIPVNASEVNYSDGNFYVDDEGKFHSNLGPNGEEGFNVPDNTTTWGGNVLDKISFGTTNRIAVRGKNQTQIVVGDDGNPELIINDYAYINTESKDKDEIPGFGWLNPKKWASDPLHKVIDSIHGRNEGDENTGELTGIPSNIRGVSNLRVTIPFDQWPADKKKAWNDRKQEHKDANDGKLGNYKPTNTGNYTFESKLLTEKNHLRDRREAKRALVEKKVGGKISKVIIPGPKDHLTVKAIDMLRQYKVSEKEMQEYANIIGQINQWIRDNPKEYAIWKIRYPANDPRLAELNWRMDQQLKASAEYVESRFPENVRLFDKLKQKIETNIQVTDPANFKDVKPVVTHKKLLQVSKAVNEDWSSVKSTIANRATQTFQHISGTTATFAGLGGVEVHPSNVTIDGENVSTPKYSDLALAGYSKPLGGILKRLKNKNTNKTLDNSQKFAKNVGTSPKKGKNADVMMNARVTPPIPDEPLPPGTKWELIPATYGGIVDGQWDPNYMVAPPSWTQVYIEDPDNRYKATPDGVTPKDPEPVTPKDNVGKVTKSDEKWLNNKQTLVNLTKWLGNISGGRLHTDFGQMAINYAKGDFTPITKFSPSMENEVLRVVNKKFKENPNKTTLTLSYGDWGISTGTLSLGTFTAHKLPNGDYKIEDTFNVNKTFKTVGWAREIPFGIGKNLQKTADRIVDIAYKRRSIGGVYDEGGIPINVIIRRKKKK